MKAYLVLLSIIAIGVVLASASVVEEGSERRPVIRRSNDVAKKVYGLANKAAKGGRRAAKNAARTAKRVAKRLAKRLAKKAARLAKKAAKAAKKAAKKNAALANQSLGLLNHINKLGKAGKRDMSALGAATKQVRNMATRDQLAAGDALKESRRALADVKVAGLSIKAKLAELKQMVRVVSRKIGRVVGKTLAAKRRPAKAAAAFKVSKHRRKRALLAQEAVGRMHIAVAELEDAHASGDFDLAANKVTEAQGHVHHAIRHYSQFADEDQVSQRAQSLIEQSAQTSGEADNIVEAAEAEIARQQD